MIVFKFLQQLPMEYLPRDDYVRLGWWMLSMPMLVAIVMHAPMAIARHWEDRNRMAIYSGVLFVAVLLGADLVYYLQAAYLRTTVPERECRVKGPSPYGPYEAVVCVTAGLPQNADTEGFVQLRSTTDGKVLAEREFYNPEFHQVIWMPDILIVGIAEGSAKFQLPPTKWDWLRAKLP